MSVLVLVVFALLIGGVVVTAVPRVPGGVLLSLSGVYLYWWMSGFSDPSTGLLILITLLGLFALASKLVGPVILSKIGGSSPITTTIGGIVGAVCFFFWGTAGLVVGMVVTVFLIEFLRRGDVIESAVASVIVVLATFASKSMKVLVTVVILVVMCAVILL